TGVLWIFLGIPYGHPIKREPVEDTAWRASARASWGGSKEFAHSRVALVDHRPHLSSHLHQLHRSQQHRPAGHTLRSGDRRHQPAIRPDWRIAPHGLYIEPNSLGPA